MHLIKTIQKHLYLLVVGLLSVPVPVLAATKGECANTRNGNVVDSTKVQDCVQHNKIITDLQTIINALSVGVGVIIIAMIIIGGIQYMMAGDNPTAITAAKQRIANALIALVAFLLIFAFVQWLVPGGVFSNP